MNGFCVYFCAHVFVCTRKRVFVRDVKVQCLSLRQCV